MGGKGMAYAEAGDKNMNGFAGRRRGGMRGAGRGRGVGAHCKLVCNGKRMIWSLRMGEGRVSGATRGVTG